MSQTIKENINKLVRLFTEQQSLDEQIKEVKEQIKASGQNPAVAASVAKSIVNGKVSELQEKAEATVELIEVSRS
jgi:uncharacterized protein (UPF0335 family)